MCKARQCVGTQCIVEDLSTDERCPVKRGVADGVALCTQQMCVDGECVTNKPYIDPGCPTSALPSGFIAQCNKRLCVDAKCVTAPWFYPSTTPTGTPPSCNDLTGHDAQCWRAECVHDPSVNAPYGKGVCGGVAVDLTPSTCPPPIVNGKAVNAACYVPRCVPGAGKCSTEIITGGPGKDPATHLGNCPVGKDESGKLYDARCYYPYCDQYGQCSGEVLSGMFTPASPDGSGGVYIPGWREDEDAPTKEKCDVPQQYDKRCYLPACIGGKCGGWVLNGSEAWRYTGGEEESCPMPADKNPACYDPSCVDGVCGGNAINVGNACRPSSTEEIPNVDPTCTSYVCAANGKCEAKPINGTPDGACPTDPTKNPSCWSPACVDGACGGISINLGIECVPLEDELVDGYTSECVVYECSAEADSRGKCVARLLPMETTCDSAHLPPDGCSEGRCVEGVCTSTPVNVGSPCSGDLSPDCNNYICVLNAEGKAECVAQPTNIGGWCEDDLDLCTEQACVVNDEGVGVCSIVHTIDCSNATVKECDPAICDSTTGQCVHTPAPDLSPCVNHEDETCGDYSCYHGECIRMCPCGNGILDEDEDCDWGEDLWCPPPIPGDNNEDLLSSDYCPEGVEPGNNGHGNGLGRNDSRSNCNETLCTVLRRPASRGGLSQGAIAGVAVAGVAVAAALGLAGFLAARAAAGAGGPGASAASTDPASSLLAVNPLYTTSAELTNPLFTAQ